MKTNIFIPQKINVGFQERSDTYTQKLAYIIYFDEKGVLRKEKSWNSWRDSKIENEIHENTPTSGFVLNKKAGGYSTGWNHRQTYVRVYDPRGFEFEISVPNLLYILENATSTKGKGLEGDFIYGWDGKDLVLIPVESPDYVEISRVNELRHAKEFVKAKDLKIGATYLGKDGQEYTYIGRFDEYSYGEKSKKQNFFFYNKEKTYSGFTTMKSISQRLVSVVSEDCVENYADLMDELETKTVYSPIDSNQNKYVPLTKEELENKFEDYGWARGGSIYIESGNTVDLRKARDGSGRYYYEYKNPNHQPSNYLNRYQGNNEPYYLRVEFEDLDEVIEKLKPLRKRQYLANGKIYSEGL